MACTDLQENRRAAWVSWWDRVESTPCTVDVGDYNIEKNAEDTERCYDEEESVSL
jgi:hypothetical protein